MSENNKSNLQSMHEGMRIKEVIKASKELAQARNQSSGGWVNISDALKTKATMQGSKDLSQGGGNSK